MEEIVYLGFIIRHKPEAKKGIAFHNRKREITKMFEGDDYLESAKAWVECHFAKDISWPSRNGMTNLSFNKAFLEKFIGNMDSFSINLDMSGITVFGDENKGSIKMCAGKCGAGNYGVCAPVPSDIVRELDLLPNARYLVHESKLEVGHFTLELNSVISGSFDREVLKDPAFLIYTWR